MEKFLKCRDFSFFLVVLLFSCKFKSTDISHDDIKGLHLKEGQVVLCGPPDKQFGIVDFEITCSTKQKGRFNLAVALLHSFEYDEAERVFAGIIEEEPDCAMAYWGVAMCNFHPLWDPPTEFELNKGAKAVQFAQSLRRKSDIESDYIQAIAAFYGEADRIDHHSRCVRFEKAMEGVYSRYPQDKEAAIFYALALDAASDPRDKSLANQRKAGAILQGIFPGEPNHPGIAHYLIHTYDNPELAELALPAARKYALIAPASAHAQHMPSHIFTRLGLWDESIQANVMSTSSARCYAENAGMRGHWGEELHGMDYLVYAYLQKADDSLAKVQGDYLETINRVSADNSAVAYAFAAIPARLVLETQAWKSAASLDIRPVDFPWKKFPWQMAIVHFARLLGSVHIGRIDSAKVELNRLEMLRDTLAKAKDEYKANQVEIQIKTSEAWILLKERKEDDALKLMDSAAEMEDATLKSPVTPGEVVPARELLGDMLIQVGNYERALEAYEMDLKTHPNRFRGLYGAGWAAEKLGDHEKSIFFYRRLLGQCSTNSMRPEIVHAHYYLSKG